MKRFYWVFTIVITLLGVVHIGATPFFYKSFNLDAIWFAGGGLAVAYAGVINIINLKAMDTFIRRIAILSNGIALLFILAIALKLFAPQVIVSIIAALGIFTCSIIHKK